MQTMTLPNLASALAPFIGNAGGATPAQSVEAGAAGAILGSIFGNR